ncbi:uncharacterized protein A4U43_C08F7800 [Asparagus officinalis]|nr:uncharacterized protein A4U43_C08F7800 [Asparagus officinalis]
MRSSSSTGVVSLPRVLVLDEDSERVCSDSMFLIVEVAVVIGSGGRGGREHNSDVESKKSDNSNHISLSLSQDPKPTEIRSDWSLDSRSPLNRPVPLEISSSMNVKHIRRAKLGHKKKVLLKLRIKPPRKTKFSSDNSDTKCGVSPSSPVADGERSGRNERIHLWREGGGRGPLKPAAAAESPLKEKEKDPALEFKERQRAFNSQEVERRIAAIRAIQVAEVQSLLSRLRLIRSYISKEQLETPALQFFQENLPNISPVINEKAKIIELKWRITENDGGIMPDSVDVSRTLQLGGYIPHSVRSVKSSYLNIANLQIPNFVLDDPLEDQMQGIRDSFQTPGETSNRLSFGMTPKTSRQPKKGEMLMSIRGSPLGVYKEENLEAIHESGDASHGGSSQDGQLTLRAARDGSPFKDEETAGISG